jgi:membrane-bound lytic murein transglycosylase B
MRCLAAIAAAALIAVAMPAAAAKKLGPKPATPPKVHGVPAGPSYGARPDLLAFAAEVAERRGLDAAWIVKELAQAHRVETVQQLMMPPPVDKPRIWTAYRDRFVEPRRIAAGAAFWQANEAWLAKAEQRWGVPPQVVIGILGMETYYGRLNGGFRVIDTLATLTFDFPSGRKDRSAFFRSELEEFLVLCDRDKLDPQQPKGSFAGAIGMPQFMPSSIRRFAVDFDGDGRIDLGASAADAIGSIARYLADNGWQRGMPTHHAVSAPESLAARALLLAQDIVPSFSATQFAEMGAALDDSGREHDGPLALVILENGDDPPSYVAGTQNFYAITRYNWSSFYAMAVIALGEAVAAARAAPPDR